MPRFGTLIPTMLSLLALAATPGCSPAAGKSPAFDQNHAFELLKKQVGFGPRYPGAPGHDLMVKFLSDELKPYADTIDVQKFTRNIRGKHLTLHNVAACFNASAKKWVLLAAHWDSRPTADEEILASKRKMPIPGANDGASGVAVLLELARVFAKQRPDIGVYVIFLDGEDYGPGENDMYLGAKYFAANMSALAKANGRPIKFDYGILLDMIGDKNLDIYYEQQSLAAAPEVAKKVWKAAADLGYDDVFIPKVKYAISDDHIPLIRAGVKCIDVIDFDYGPWHTLDDTADKCSPASLKIVGETIARVIYQESGSQSGVGKRDE